ncbi:adrenodoxin-like protein ferredoxin 2fe-2s-like protein [Leptomonas seymouri]|uniref:Adrenodoxin-like protein ferredoxin 2fe-2s-like protein n=1 Tax=Leptomonas seymouri TaxID=5684 RepID=A0A0N0P6W3_LEPSE|nr:adrenodoxin-like protein ferredoxin 2fe-2s-like protein [Leptomonas seymouri]|eukprot:KPI88079.1 adrenodoxin-like protein ferredoxin 2fe-2s-like protein [Leptomonas seymouri]
MRPCLLSATCAAAITSIIPHVRYSTPGKVQVHVRKRDGSRFDFDAPVGISLMQALRDVAHLDVAGTCDGEMECGTCHVYLSEASFARAGEPSEEEQDLLDKVLAVRDTSRLSCGVDLAPDLDGIEIELPSCSSDVSWDTAAMKPR